MVKNVLTISNVGWNNASECLEMLEFVALEFNNLAIAHTCFCLDDSYWSSTITPTLDTATMCSRSLFVPRVWRTKQRIFLVILPNHSTNSAKNGSSNRRLSKLVCAFPRLVPWITARCLCCCLVLPRNIDITIRAKNKPVSDSPPPSENSLQIPSPNFFYSLTTFGRDLTHNLQIVSF